LSGWFLLCVYISIYLEFYPPIDIVIFDLVQNFNIRVAQVGPGIWRLLACLRLLTNLAKINFLLRHFLHLYSPKIFWGGIFFLFIRGSDPW
ncbi:hypothetical protein A4A49_53603, partial [Nicotiana attenuata]